MSTTAPVPSTTPTPTAQTPEREEIKVVSHSNLFYWWPVWAVGFLMALLTLFDGSRMTTVPPGSKYVVVPEITIAKANDEKETLTKREGILLPKDENKPDKSFLPRDSSSLLIHPQVHMSKNKSYGVIFCVTLLICIVITNVPLRGMWSLVVIITVVMLSIIFALAGWWEWIFTKLSLLDIRINMGGYLFISGTLFVIWLITLLFFDQQVYIVFTPGQFKVCTEIGGGERVYDVAGMKLERQKGDLFRHKILGLGSGDLVVKTAGAQGDHFDLPNVLFVRQKVQQIERMLKQRQVVGAA